MHPQTPSEAGPIAVPALRGVQVLAVDDHLDSLALLRESLEATGATVMTADSGQEALKKLGTASGDIHALKTPASTVLPRMQTFQGAHDFRASAVTQLS